MLRIAYGESLNTDCGGGSLASNVQLLFYQLLTADMFDKDAQVDQPVQSQHARCLSTGFLAACTIASADSSKSSSLNQLTRGIADAAPMALLTSVLFHNATDDDNASGSSNDESCKPHPKRQWLVGKDYFLRGLLICAGRRHALRLESSGCNTSRGPMGRQRASSFAEWDLLDGSENPDAAGSSSGFSFARASSARGNSSSNSSSSRRRGSSKATIEDFQNAIRPMITLYAIVDHLSAEFSLAMEDVQIQESAERLVYAIEECQRSKSIHELLDKAKVMMDHEEMMEYLQKGMIVA
jgi:hypothetical protein